MSRIYVVGFMGSGKSTLGKKLARKLGFAFADTDRLVEEKHQLPVHRIFQLFGESVFREMETAALKQSLEYEHAVIATGGGLPCYGDNMKFILEHGTSIYLEASVELLTDRLSAGKGFRPLIAGMSKDDLRQFIIGKLAEREGYYLQSSHVVRVPVESVESLVKSIGLDG